MSEKKTAVPAAPAAEVPASEPKTRKASGTPARRGRPPLTPEVYVEYGGNQYNITDVVERPRPITAPPTKWASSPARFTSNPKRALLTTSSTKFPANWSCNFPCDDSSHTPPAPRKQETKKTAAERSFPLPQSFLLFPGVTGRTAH